jgi:hypothetical protein
MSSPTRQTHSVQFDLEAVSTLRAIVLDLRLLPLTFEPVRTIC